MLLVGSILPAGAGAQLWQLTGAAPADIELNSSAGADGINTAAPGAPDVKLLLQLLATAQLGSFEATKAAELLTVGVIRDDTTVDLAAGISYVDNVNNLYYDIVIDAITKDILLEAYNLNDDYISQKIIPLEHRVTACLLSVKAISTVLNATYFEVQNGADLPVFKVRKDGQLETNQTAASVAVRVKVAELPIYDTAGALVGYININT